MFIAAKLYLPGLDPAVLCT